MVMKKSMLRVCVGLALVIDVFIPAPGHAHRPTISDGRFGSAESAFLIDDLAISIAVYHEVTCAAPELWLAFDARAGDELYLQLGVPLLDRLAGFRPSVALLGPGLPEPADDLPFDIPEQPGQELGAIVFHSSEVEEPAVFLEEFTGTRSWILRHARQYLSREGRYYLVAWNPAATTGTLWLATGEVDDFTGVDPEELAMTVERIKAFHELPGYEPDEAVTEESCADGSAGGGCGCSAEASPGNAWSALFILLIVLGRGLYHGRPGIRRVRRRALFRR